MRAALTARRGLAARRASAGRPAFAARVASLAAVAVLLVSACGSTASPAPTVHPESSVAPPATSGPAGSAAPGRPSAASPAPSPVLPLPPADAGDPSASAILLQNQDGRYDAYRGIGRFDGPSTCTATLLETATGDAARAAPAYVLTNGHCVGLWDTNEVVVAQDPPASTITMRFDYFAHTADGPVAEASAVSWATMKGTDLAIVRLDTTLGALADMGVHPFPIATSLPAPGTPIVNVAAPVGAPVVDLPDDQRFLRLGTCTVEGDPVGLVERQWRWWTAIRNDCPDVWPGSSGSPILDLATGELVGAINTTTIGSAGGTDCWLGRPCEVTLTGTEVKEDTSYAMPVVGLRDCFAADGSLEAAGACPLDPGIEPAIYGFVGAVNPTLPVTIDRPARWRWDVEVVSETLPYYRYKTGPVGTTDCRDEAGYGMPVAIADRATIADPLPTAEGVYIACVLGGPAATVGDGWQEPRFASIALAFVDLTPPATKVEWSIRGDASSGWDVEPIFKAPELSDYDLKAGPRATTDCADADGYAPYRRVPIRVAPDEAPATVCAIGYDDAGNATTPAELKLPEDQPAP